MINITIKESDALAFCEILMQGMRQVDSVPMAVLGIFFDLARIIPKAPAVAEQELPLTKPMTKELKRLAHNAYQRKYSQDRAKFKSLKASGKLPKGMTIAKYRASL